MNVQNRRVERRRAVARRLRLAGGVAIVATVSFASMVVDAAPASAAGTPINGGGSSFAAPAITQWDANVRPRAVLVERELHDQLLWVRSVLLHQQRPSTSP